MKVETAAQRIRKILKDNTFKRETLQTSGKVYFNRLPFYKSSRHLFTKPNDLKGKNYHIELLIDRSGSMYGSSMPNVYPGKGGEKEYVIQPISSFSLFKRVDRITPAIQSGEIIASVMGKYCDLNITLFNYLETRVSYKDFRNGAFWTQTVDSLPKALLVNDDQGGLRLTASWEKAYNDRGEFNGTSYFDQAAGNWELCNILNAATRLKKKDGRKVILILLDGKPNLDDFGGENPISGLYVAERRPDLLPIDKYKKIIQGLESQGIEVVAFGIDTDKPKAYFSNFEYIDSASEKNAILPALLRQLKRIVR